MPSYARTSAVCTLARPIARLVATCAGGCGWRVPADQVMCSVCARK